jgi:hypothetical protein
MKDPADGPDWNYLTAASVAEKIRVSNQSIVA